MLALKIKKASRSDIIAINEITNYAIINSDFNLNSQAKTIRETSVWFDSHRNLNYPVIVACIDDYVVGWASLSRFRDFSGYNQTAEVSVYVRKKYCRMGIGKALLKALESEAAERGFHCMVSVITATNRPSLRLHEKTGFSLAGTFKEVAFKNNEYLDVVFMTKIINKKNEKELI